MTSCWQNTGKWLWYKLWIDAAMLQVQESGRILKGFRRNALKSRESIRKIWNCFNVGLFKFSLTTIKEKWTEDSSKMEASKLYFVPSVVIRRHRLWNHINEEWSSSMVIKSYCWCRIKPDFMELEISLALCISRLSYECGSVCAVHQIIIGLAKKSSPMCWWSSTVLLSYMARLFWL